VRRFRGRGGRWTRPRTAMTSQLHGIWPESGSGGPVGGVRFEISNGGSCRRRMRVGLRGRVRSRNEAGYELCGCASTAWGVGRRGRGCKRLGVRRPRGAGAAGARMRAFGRTSTTCGSRGEGRMVGAWHVMEGCRLFGAAADRGRAVGVDAVAWMVVIVARLVGAVAGSVLHLPVEGLWPGARRRRFRDSRRRRGGRD